MMSGAWIAATQDRTRFKRINGYGSKAFEAKIVLTTIHKISTPVNAKMNAQLPANFAIASAARCPSVYFSVVGFSEILLSASRFRTSSSVISCWMSLRTSFRSFRFSFIWLPLLSGIFFIILRSPRRGQAACPARALGLSAAKQENARRQKASGQILRFRITAYSF